MATFQMGNLMVTQAVSEKMRKNILFYYFVENSLARYTKADWSDMGPKDRAANDAAVADGNVRILAAYQNKNHADWNIFIITEADRSHTTILFASEY